MLKVATMNNRDRERVSVFAPTQFRRIAKSEKRSVSNLAFKVLSDFVEQHSAPQPKQQTHIVKTDMVE